jgi:UDP-2,3-diacylglucosamine hydrolase
MSQLFISDLHLNDSCPHITRAFFHFLRTRAIHAEALYILGDFFDVWVGDDDDAALAQEVASELNQLNQQGVAIYFMHGNRDFLLGESYATKAGMTLINEDVVIDLYGTPTLLTHGDSLCTGDAQYQQFRTMVRNAAWQQEFLSQSLATRRAIAAQLRETSQSMNSMKKEDIMDVAQDEVIAQMQQANVTRLVHGHTHRPARHILQINDQECERIVLGDWHDHGWCLNATSSGLTLESWAI